LNNISREEDFNVIFFSYSDLDPGVFVDSWYDMIEYYLIDSLRKSRSS